MVAGNVAGDDLGGRGSSREVGPDTRGHGEARGEVLRASASTVKTMACSESSQHGCGHDGDVRWRRRVRPSSVWSLWCTRRQTERGRKCRSSQRIRRDG